MMCKIFILSLIFCLCPFTEVAIAQLPAFPGAEGAGALTPGGRGGQVLFVTNLNNNGPGSFREAVDGPVAGPRIVVFRVSGIIDLASSITIDKPYLTIAGQTAPGDGICIRGNEIRIERTHDIVIRHIRFRPGDVSGAVPQNWQGDCLSITGANNIIVDHCSLTWSVDEISQIYGGGESDPQTTDITYQWNIIGESLRDSTHEEGPHGANLLVRTDGGRVSVHHNLLIHGDARNPRLGSVDNNPLHRTVFDFRNNVVYNWGDVNGAGGGRQEFADLNYVANWVQTGPATHDDQDTLFKSGTTNAAYAGNYRIYQTGNRLDGADPGWGGFKEAFTQLAAPVEMPAVTTQTAAEARDAVLAAAGAMLPARDSVDIRLVNDVTNETGEIIDSQSEVGGWPAYASAPFPADNDNDGMPDAWEDQHGLNKLDPTDHRADADNDGYTNIEEYLNGTNPRDGGAAETRARGNWMMY